MNNKTTVILASNIEDLKSQGVAAKDGEISIGVLEKEIGKASPTLYAFRQGMIYDPTDGFKPNIAGNHKLPDKLIEEYYKLRDKAREELEKVKKGRAAAGGNNKEDGQKISELESKIIQKDARIIEQTKIINDLKANQNNKQSTDDIQTLKTMINELSAIQSKRIEIKIGDKAPKLIEKVLHESMNDILGLLLENEAAYLYGPAGTGKSEIAKQAAEIMDVDFYPASTITQEYKLTGFIDGNGKYHETNFYKALKYGGLFFLDEMDSCISDVLVGINGALANRYFDFPIGTIQAHENFKVIGAGNTTGRGANDEYTGRNTLDLSTLDRFWGVKIDYSPAIEKAITQNDNELIGFAHVLRETAAYNGISIMLSYRGLGRLANFQHMFPLEKIMEMVVIKGAPIDDMKILANNMNIDSNNKYYKAFKAAI